ncbi:MAG: SpoIIE family protein phosphatase [Nitrospinae bacterium]|nr:SpoIIE family protein phosphatase [Nitrospinota bacterium]
MRPVVLIVDDNPINVKLLVVIMCNHYDLLTAQSGAEGREIALKEQPDLILLDIMMPGEDGYETCAKLKNNPQTANIPVIFVTAMGDTSSKVKGLSMGSVDYITKPFEKDEILARVGLHLKLDNSRKKILQESKAQTIRLKQLGQAQRDMLVLPADIPEASFGVNYVSLLEAGGDFYDVFKVSDGVYGYFMADISGHNISTSYGASALKALIYQNVKDGATPEAMFDSLNSAMKKVLSSGTYLTACYCLLDRNKSELQLVNCAHLPIIHIKGGESYQLFKSNGPVIGAFDSVAVNPVKVPVQPGDRVFIYTDGLIERFGTSKRDVEDAIKELSSIALSKNDLPIEKAVEEISQIMLSNREECVDDAILLGFIV